MVIAADNPDRTHLRPRRSSKREIGRAVWRTGDKGPRDFRGHDGDRGPGGFGDREGGRFSASLARST